MAVLKVYHWNDPLLTTPSKPVGKLTRELKGFIDDMFETMYAAPGIGLAANQVGKSLQILIYDEGWATERDKKEKYQNQPRVLINPQIVKAEGSQTFSEGCLSHPGFEDEITRSSKIVVKAKDGQYKNLEFVVEGFLATVIQHEMDHLQGIRVIDRVSRLKRSLYIKQYTKEFANKPI
jgi:peptide deformylase